MDATHTLSSSSTAFRARVKQDPSKPIDVDLVVIGGGITGAGILREAARRGLSAVLVEQKDFAWGTSSRSSKMVHGGLRYLGEGNFRLTRESVLERQRYLDEAPGLVNLMNYIMLHDKKQFPPRWLFQLLLTIYDFFAGKKYRKALSSEDFQRWLGPLRLSGDKSSTIKASVFSDAVTDDSRLVIRTLQEAVNDGGVALNYCPVVRLLSDDTDKNESLDSKISGVEVHDSVTDQKFFIRSKLVVNATGAQADQFNAQLKQDIDTQPVIRPLRGSHLVVPFWALPVSCSITIFHPEDKRPVFAFPWQGSTVIGTTDLDHKESLTKEASITADEVDYLLKAINHNIDVGNVSGATRKLSLSNVISTWAGVRPVISSGKGLDPSKENREHSCWQQPGLISVSGGKLTTFRVIALDVLNKGAEVLGLNVRQDTEQQVFSDTNSVQSLLGQRCYKSDGVTTNARSSVSSAIKRRLAGLFGNKAPQLVSSQNSAEYFSNSIGASDYSWPELEWSLQNESICHLDDLLLRRTRLGNVMPQMNGKQWFKIKHLCSRYLNWTEAKWAEEYQRYRDIWQSHYWLPQSIRHEAGLQGPFLVNTFEDELITKTTDQEVVNGQ